MVAPSVTMASLSPLLLQSSGHPAGASSFLSRLRGWHRAERCPCGDWHSGAVSQEQVSPGILRCCVPPPSSTLSISSLLCPDNKMRLWVSERRRFLRAVFWHRVRQVHTAWAEIPRCVTRCQTTWLPQRVLALFPAGLPWGGCCCWLFLWYWACFLAPELLLLVVPQPPRAFFCTALSTAMPRYEMHAESADVSTKRGEGNRLFT